MHLLFDKNKKITILEILIKISLLLTPILMVFLYFFKPNTTYKNIFVFFIILVVFERIFETFYIKKTIKNKNKQHDRMLELITLSYMILILIISFEFFCLNRQINILYSFISFSLFLVAFFIRWWGIQTLSSQWNIFINKNNIQDSTPQLRKNGPYKYVRHPIYLGFILEVLSLPLIVNSIYGVLFSLFIFIPLIVKRALLEENELLYIFGEEYKRYKKNTTAFIPFLKFLRR